MDTKKTGVLAALGVLGLVAACSALEPLEPGVCGNGVVDTNEDCDYLESQSSTRASKNDKSECAPPGDRNACRFVCDALVACPAGFACNLNDGYCVKPSGAFERELTSEIGAVRMVRGDFDGDGRTDLVLSQPSGLDGTSSASGLFFAEGMRIRERRAIPIPVGVLQAIPSQVTESAAAASVAGDGGADAGASEAGTGTVLTGSFPLTDLGYSSSFGLGILRGSVDDPFVPELLPFQSLEAVFDGARPDGPKVAFKIASVIPVPFPPLDGSSRGRVKYFGAAVTLDGKATNVFPLGGLDQKPDRPTVVATLPGGPGQVRFTSGPVDGTLCLKLGGNCGQVFAWSKDNPLLVLLDPDIPVAPKFDFGGAIQGVGMGTLDDDDLQDVAVSTAPGNPLPNDAACPFVLSGLAVRTGTVVGAPKRAHSSACPTNDRYQPFLGLADLNGDGVSDFVYSASIYLSQKSGGGGDAGTGATTWKLGYSRITSGWTQMEVGDFDGDGRTDAILAVEGQANLDVIRGGTGEIRALSVPTPEPVSTIVAGHFDGDRMLDIAYSTKVGGTQTRAASVYIVFGGPENETVRVGRKDLSELVNLRRPFGDIETGKNVDRPFPDVDFLGMVQDPDTAIIAGPNRNPTKSVIYAVYSAQGRAPTSFLNLRRSDNAAAALGGRGVAFGSFTAANKLDALRLTLANPASCTPGFLDAISDLLVPPPSTASDVRSTPIPYGARLPLAVISGAIGGTDSAFAVSASRERKTLVFQRVKLATDPNGGATPPVLETIYETPYDVQQADACKVTPGAQDLYPSEKLALVDIDADGALDLVFSDGGRVPLDKRFQDNGADIPGALVVLRGDGKGGFSPVVTADGSPLTGRSFATVRIAGNRPALAVLGPNEVVFYTYADGVLAPVRDGDGRAKVSLGSGGGRALEAGDFDGDGVEDLAVLANGVLTIYGGTPAAAGPDGGAP